ncbi:MAG: tRNA (adenosine(37)-N6)-dimethylallyltransferase MiaA [Clostridiaceae bacterium]|jgi:tRNA dimethylallyltransferase|nr:tRNA (adenosine(37)-N6)-dimethylallyltransferase MiaA [Clostridiaceae bacterium]
MVFQTHIIQADTQELMLELVRKDLAGQDADLIPILTGPTASGKSSLAMRWCELEDRELISADSMQIYRGFDIGTAKASQDEQKRVLHHLIDIKDANDRYSVANFVNDASEILSAGQSEGRRFLICGGTGQYISALYEGLKFSDPAPTEEFRHSINEMITKRGLKESYALLAALDPEAAEQISPANRRRIVRFFEKFELTGKTLSELNAESRLKSSSFKFRVYQLNWECRQDLYNRINQRTEEMYDDGLISETRSLMERYDSYSTAPAFSGIGYREAIQYINGRLTEAEARENTATASRRYAKRQLTWFRPKEYVNSLLYTSKICQS